MIKNFEKFVTSNSIELKFRFEKVWKMDFKNVWKL